MGQERKDADCGAATQHSTTRSGAQAKSGEAEPPTAQPSSHAGRTLSATADTSLMMRLAIS